MVKQKKTYQKINYHRNGWQIVSEAPYEFNSV